MHSSVESPRRVDARGSIDDDDYNDYDCDYEFDGENQEEVLQRQQEKLSQLYNLLQAEPKDLIRFEDEGSSGVRGMYLNHSVKNGEIILKLPLSSCLTDDRPPSWLHDEVKNDPHRWATRLAASWADLHLKNKLAAGGKNSDNDDDNNDNDNSQQVDEGHAVWSSLLPDPEYLRASLPVHWPETTVLNARSTALELAVDSAFFARAEAVDDLFRGFQRSPYAEIFSNNDDDDSKDGMDMDMDMSMNELAHHALDMIQTRSCRLEEKHALDDDDNENRVEYRRVLAPIFDFINHGSQNAATGSANAYFALEEEEQQSTESSSSSSNIEKYLVVRSMKDISQDEEVKMDYGGSARPAWKCLLSYGFVPEYKRTMDNADGGENLAEVYMKGVRYEVSDDSVPIDMVADATPLQWLEDEDDQQTNDTNATPPELVLTPDIALRIAERIADAAYYLLLEPEQILDDSDSKEVPPTPFEVISKQLAASLRWSQHRILLTCAAGLTQFAKENSKEEESTCHP